MEKGKTTTYAKIVVDCIKNDAQDIRMGGPEYLGFDFFIDNKQTEEIKTFIKETLEENKVPLINMYSEDVEEQPDYLWNKQKIKQEIEKEIDWYIVAGYIDEPEAETVDDIEKTLEKTPNKN